MSSEWRTVTVEEIAAPVPAAMATGPFGSSISAKHFTKDGVPVIRGSNLSSDVSTRLLDAGLVFVSAEKALEFQRSTVRRGDLIFTCWGTINQVGFIDSRSKYASYVVSNKQMKLTVDHTKADARFIYYVFSGPDKQAEILDNGIGSSVPGFNLGQLKRHEVFLPPLVDQVAIADFLESIDDRIALLHETNATLEAVAQALFKSWFVNFDPVRAKIEGRSPEGMDEATAALFPDSFEESALGLVPKAWRVREVSDVVNTVGGATPDTKNSAFWEPSVHPWTTPKDLSGLNSPVLLATERLISPLGLAKIGSGSLPVGTLLMSSRAPIGYLAIAQMPVAINQGYIAIPPGSELPPLFMLFWCQQNMETIKGRANGSTFMEISKKAFRPIPLVVPSPAIVNAFQDAAKALFDRLVVNAQQAQTLAELRDSLLPRLISGQLRVPELEEANA